jgi:hypothetical protein
MDPYKASYGVEDPEFAITQLAQTTMRSELGKISLGMFRRVPYNLGALCEVAGKFVIIVHAFLSFWIPARYRIKFFLIRSCGTGTTIPSFIQLC